MILETGDLKMYYTLDRFEEEYAVMIGDDETEILIENKILGNCNEGDVFEMIDGKYKYLKNETEMRKNENHDLMKKLLSRKK